MVRKLSKLFRRSRPDFIGRLIKQAESTVAGMNGLIAYMEHHNPESAEAVRRAEKDADEERRLLIDELNRTFVTPIDREDIFALSRAIDDVLECHHVTGVHTLMVKVKTENTQTLEMLIEQIRSLEGVSRTETMVARSTQTEHQRIALDTRDEFVARPPRRSGGRTRGGRSG